ncbi:MAG: hypothetical protein ABL889_05890 [Terricaulis sp.]
MRIVGKDNALIARPFATWAEIQAAVPPSAVVVLDARARDNMHIFPPTQRFNCGDRLRRALNVYSLDETRLREIARQRSLGCDRKCLSGERVKETFQRLKVSGRIH